MVVEKKSGDFKTVEIRLPSWMHSKVALAVMVAVLIAGFIWMTPGLNTAVFGTNAKTTGPPQEVKTAEVQPAENAVVNAAVTDWQKKLETDLQDTNKKWAIDRLTGTNKALIPIGTKEVALTNSILLTGISVDRKTWTVSGYIENKGTTPVDVRDGLGFSAVGENYMPIYSSGIKILNNVDLDRTGRGDSYRINPGQKLSFKTNPVRIETIPPDNQQKYLEALQTAPSMAIAYNTG